MEKPPEEGADAQNLDSDEAYVDTVDDGINMADDDISYSYLQIIKHSILAYLSNPWALLILFFLLYKIYTKLKERYINPILYRYEDWMERRKEKKEDAEYKKNPDLYQAKMEAMERARVRLQEHYEKSAQEWKQKQTEKEEKKRQMEIEEWENHQEGKGYKSRVKSGVDKEKEALEQQARIKSKKGFRPEYNPLMGMGGGSGYRPSPRRSGGG